MDTTKEAYRAKMEAQLDGWSSQIKGLKAKADKAHAVARIRIIEHLDELKALEASAKRAIAEVEKSATPKWQQIKGEIEQGWNELSGSIDALWTRISADQPRTN